MAESGLTRLAKAPPATAAPDRIGRRAGPRQWRAYRTERLMAGAALALALLIVATRVSISPSSWFAYEDTLLGGDNLRIELFEMFHAVDVRSERPAPEEGRLLDDADGPEPEVAPPGGTPGAFEEILGGDEPADVAPEIPLPPLETMRPAEPVRLSRSDPVETIAGLIELTVPSIEEVGIENAPTLEDILVDYPRSAWRKKIEGRVVVSFLVETDGRAYDVRVVRSDHPVLAPAALKGIRDARFVPGMRNGSPIPSRMRLSIRFNINT